MEALTIKTLKTSKISAVEVSERHSKDLNYKSIRFAYDRGKLQINKVCLGQRR